MEPDLKTIERLSIYGYRTRTQNKDEFNPNTAKIPGAWIHFYESPLARSTEIYGVYSDYESNVDGFYTLTLGVSSAENKTGLDEVVIQSGDYLVFHNAGPFPGVVIKTWGQIWGYFMNNPSYQRHFLTDFERYAGENTVEIYIGVNVDRF